MSNPELRRLGDRPYEPNESYCASGSWTGFTEPGAVIWTGRRVRAFLRIKLGYTDTKGRSNDQVMAANPCTLPVYTSRGGYDAELCDALQDLADDINEDVRSACIAAFNGGYYPGVEDIIEPVTDEHVRVVMTAMQRELVRETRFLAGTYEKLPAVELASFPWPVQRALAERRRYRYLQFGITREVWKRNEWSPSDVPEDPDYCPLRLLRGMPSGNDVKPTEWVVG